MIPRTRTVDHDHDDVYRVQPPPAHLIASRAARYESGVAVHDSSRAYTYRELDAVSDAMARALRRSGLNAGDVVAWIDCRF
jgi:non-ribosomal peptide synthetase component E (peptide arylation enzyme)